MSWNYQREEREFMPIPEGAHRVRIKSAEKVISKTGKDMLSLKFAVSGQNSTLYHYIVFLPDRPEITNRNLTQFFDSFKDIPDGDFNTANWVGKVGACYVKHEVNENSGKTNAKVWYFINSEKQDTLPVWREPETASASDFSAAPVDDGDDLPF